MIACVTVGADDRARLADSAARPLRTGIEDARSGRSAQTGLAACSSQNVHPTRIPATTACPSS